MSETTTVTADRPTVLTSFGLELAASLYRHRLLTTSQIKALHAADVTLRGLQKRLARLEDNGWLTRVQGLAPVGESRWFLTGSAADLVEEYCPVTPRGYRMNAERAVWARHLLAVNDVGTVLTEAARSRGDVFDGRHWIHEIPHPYGPGDNEVIISDAVLTYKAVKAETISAQRRFLEVDRGGESVEELVGKLRGYAALHDYTPRRRRAAKHLPRTWWRRKYPFFPEVLFVFADLADSQASRRAENLAAWAGNDPQVAAADHLTVTVTTLAELQEEGPFEPIFRRLPTLERVPLVQQGRL